MNKQNILTDVLNIFFKHQIQLKMYHFQTKSYGAHKASDSYLDGFLDKFDRFMEVAQGAFGRVETKNISASIETVSDDSINLILDKFIKELRGFDTKFVGYSELLNIRDELIADAEQLKYLLTFK